MKITKYFYLARISREIIHRIIIFTYNLNFERYFLIFYSCTTELKAFISTDIFDRSLI